MLHVTARHQDIPGRTTIQAVPERPRSLSLSLEVPADVTSLPVIRQAVGGAATAAGLEPGRVADLRLALTETVSTSLRPGGGAAVLAVAAGLEDDVFSVHVAGDEAERAVLQRDLPLPLVAALTDGVEVAHRPGGGTLVTLRFAVAG